MARYLVTGAAGFIGSKVSEFLLAQGHTVVGIDNMNDAYDVRLKRWRLDQVRTRPCFTFCSMDIRDKESLRGLWGLPASRGDSHRSTFDAVVNLAARAGVRASLEEPWMFFETNLTGTLNLLELCREFGVAKFVQASTSSLYGGKGSGPSREDATTDRPLSPYAASKKAAEALCYTYHHHYELDVTVLRYFTVYGPAGRPDMSLFRFVQWISESKPVIVYGTGEQERDFTFVDDIARGTVAALRPTGYEVINLGCNGPTVLNDVLALVERLTGHTATIERQPHHPADVRATWADIGKAERLLGWKPEIGLEEGVQRLVSWYRQNQSWASKVQT